MQWFGLVPKDFAVAAHAYSHGGWCSVLARLTEGEGKVVEQKCSVWVVVAHL
jgi:hypothetical protein